MMRILKKTSINGGNWSECITNKNENNEKNEIFKKISKK